MNPPAAAALSEQELLRAVVDSSFDLKSLIGFDYRYLYANPACLKYWHKEISSVIGHTVGEVLGEPLFRERIKPLLDRALAGEKVSFSSSSVFPGRETRNDDTLYTPARNRLGEIFGVIAVVRDMTDLKQTKSALLSSQDINRVTFEHAGVGIGHVGLQGAWLEVNPRLCEIVGYPRETLITLTIQDITHPDDLEAYHDHVRSLIDGRTRTCSVEKRYLRADGEVIWIELTVSLVRDTNGDPLHFISFVQDIQARKIAELELIQSRHQLADAVQEIGDKAVSLERFVYVLSHDLREPLNTIDNFAGLLAGEDAIGAGTAARKYLG